MLHLAAGNDLKNSFKNVFKAAEKAFKYLFESGNYSPEDLSLEPYQKLIDETYKVFEKTILDNQVPERMANALKSDAFLFGGLKVHAQLSEAFDMMKERSVKSFQEIKKEFTEINNQYNMNWLEAEYNFAVNSSQMAAKWEELDDSGRYLLQYRTAEDDRVRPEHEELAGTTLPKDDDFWLFYYPPNGWNCRCTVVEVRREKYDESDSEEAIKKGERATTQIGKDGQNRAEMFRFNPGMEEKLFPEHPYSKVKGAKEVKEIVEKENKIKTRLENNRILKSDRESQFNVIYEKESGKVKEHLLVGKKDDYKDILAAGKHFAKQGLTAELMPEINQKEKSIRNVLFPNLQSKTSNPDLKVGNKYFDIKRPSAIKNILGRANEASKQGAIAIISDSRLDKPLTDKIIEERTKSIFESKYYQFNQVIFIRKNVFIIKNRTGDK